MNRFKTIIMTAWVCVFFGLAYIAA
ncbi:uncharacterized protein METZ01_LOCUS176709, partial [marine metagenome]